MPIIGVIDSSKAKGPVVNFRLYMPWTGYSFYSSDSVTWAGEPITGVSFNDSNFQGIGQGIFIVNNRLLANYYGGMITSTNGTTYSYTGANNFNVLNNTIFVNGAYWNAANAVATSTDGLTWTFPAVGAYINFISIAHGAGTFVALGSLFYYTSTDGITWTSRTLPANANPQGIIYSDKFIMFGFNQSTNAGYIATSTDGISWASRTPPSTSSGSFIYSVAWNGSAYVATIYQFNRVGYSTDGISWVNYTLSTTETNWAFAAAGGGNFVISSVGGNGQVAASTNGISWTMRTFLAGTPSSMLTYGFNKFYLVISRQLSPNNAVMTSTDTITWTFDNAFAATGISWGTDAVRFNNVYYTVGAFPSSVIWTSTDGVAWTTRTVGTLSGSVQPRGLCAGQNLLLLGTSDSQIFTSTDGITWTSRTSPAFPTGIRSIANGPSVSGRPFVLTYSDNRWAFSTDGATWTLGAGSLTSNGVVMFGGGLYVVVGNSGVIQTSTDAVTWTTRASGGNRLRYAIYANNQFVAFGNAGTIQTSTDGITWITQTTPSAAPTIQNIKYVAGIGYCTNALPQTETDRYAILWTSTNAVTWTTRQIINASLNANSMVALL